MDGQNRRVWAIIFLRNILNLIEGCNVRMSLTPFVFFPSTATLDIWWQIIMTIGSPNFTSSHASKLLSTKLAYDIQRNSYKSDQTFSFCHQVSWFYNLFALQSYSNEDVTSYATRQSSFAATYNIFHISCSTLFKTGYKIGLSEWIYATMWW